MRRFASTPSDQACEHLADTVPVPGRPLSYCEDCLTDGAAGITLRVCLTCGKVGCAEGSVRNHAAGHYAETDHPVAAVLGADPPSRWCYPDQRSV
jgi:monovalent cation/hydrogen antiporter